MESISHQVAEESQTELVLLHGPSVHRTKRYDLRTTHLAQMLR